MPQKHFSSFIMAGLLDRSLWHDERRSDWITPVFIQRFCGSRRHKQVFSKHDHWELILCMSGKGFQVFQDHSVELAAGSALLIPPGVEHCEAGGTSDWDTLWIWIDGKWGDKLAHQPVLVEDASELLYAGELLSDWQHRHQGSIGPELDGLTAFLIQGVVRLSREPKGVGTWLPRVLGYIESHLGDPIDVSDCARVAEYSLGHFQREFRNQTGLTPWQFITKRRMQRALVHLRQSDSTISDISRLCGFVDPLHFSRAFRKHFGSSPSQIRDRWENGEQ